MHLGEEKDLSWNERLQIVIDISHGIEYLHEGVCLLMYFSSYTMSVYIWLISMCMAQAVPPVIHRDLKSANILLDHSMRATVSFLPTSVFDTLDCQ